MDSNNSPQKPQKRYSTFVQYSGIGFQMLGTIGLGVWAGMQLDAWQGNKTPGWTIGLSLTAIFASLYLFVKQLPKE